MPTGDDQAERRKRDRLIREEVGGHVPVDVVNAHQGQSTCEGDHLRRGQPHQERPLEARAGRGRHGIDPIKADAGIRHRGREDRTDALHMVARGDLRHHSTETRMYVHLRSDDIREDATTVLHHGGGGLIAARLNTEQAHPVPPNNAGARS